MLEYVVFSEAELEAARGRMVFMDIKDRGSLG